MHNDRLRIVTIGDEKYLVEKFDAITGLKIARLIMAKLAPVVPLLMDVLGDKAAENEKAIEAFTAALGAVDDADIDGLVRKCLMVCAKSYPAGPEPVLHADGTYGVPEVQYSIPLTVKLCIEAIKWGASDFFGVPSPASDGDGQPTLWQKLKGMMSL